MSKQGPIVCLGESLIDFLSLGEHDGAEVFRKQPGGAPMNVACAAARLGQDAAFLGKLGDDTFGRFLRDVMQEESVDVSGLVLTEEARTGLAFVSLDKDGDRSFTFYRDPAADMLLTEDDLDNELLARARVFHHGSISLIAEPARGATLAARARARAAGALISYDPNLRELLWDSLDDARARILSAMEGADIVKVSEAELAFLTGEDNDAGVAALLDRGPEVLVTSRGKDGCSVRTRSGLSVDEPGMTVGAVDTTGAGDAFISAFLVSLLNDDVEDAAALTDEQVTKAAKWGCAAGALSTTKHGALDGLPSRDLLVATVG